MTSAGNLGTAAAEAGECRLNLRGVRPEADLAGLGRRRRFHIALGAVSGDDVSSVHAVPHSPAGARAKLRGVSMNRRKQVRPGPNGASVRSCVVALALLAGCCVPTRSIATEFLPGNLLVITQEVGNYTYPSYLIEVTPTGQEIQRVLIPRPGDQRARDVVIDDHGRAHVYNGTFDPRLSTFDPSSGTWEHRALAGWSCINNTTYGGIARTGSSVLVTDQLTFGPGQMPEEIVRFPRDGGVGDRPVTGKDYIDLALGLDGLIYALDANRAADGRYVDVYDPESLVYLRTITLPFGTEIRAIAVDASGSIFGASWHSTIYRFTPTGATVASVQITALGACYTGLTDIDISPDGYLFVGCAGWGQVLVTPSTLQAGQAHVFSFGWDFATTGTFVNERPVPVAPRSLGGVKALFR